MLEAALIWQSRERGFLHKLSFHSNTPEAYMTVIAVSNGNSSRNKITRRKKSKKKKRKHRFPSDSIKKVKQYFPKLSTLFPVVLSPSIDILKMFEYIYEDKKL